MTESGHPRLNGISNGHPGANGTELLQRIDRLDKDYFELRKAREPVSTYAAGESDRMNPTPKGIDPLGSDADYHYRTERNYFLMVERGRSAVRNHPLVEQGINRLIANLKLGEETLDVDSGDPELDADHKAFWQAWAGETTAGRNECDYEGSRSFSQIVRQSFFNQVQDGDILHLPLIDGRLQTWESHHIRNPYGHRPTGLSQDGMVHGAEVVRGQTVAYHVTPLTLSYGQRLTRRGQTRRFPVYDYDGCKVSFWMGFRHRFFQRRGISRLSAPRDAMTGFDDTNYAHIKSSLRRALISYLMEDAFPPNPATEYIKANAVKGLPQSGDRYAATAGVGLKTFIVEQQGEAAQVFMPPDGKKITGWNANLPSSQWFEHAALMLTMLSVNLDLPLMFLLLDGSLVNFHGGRMTTDQCRMRFNQLRADQIQGLHAPTYEWLTRRRMTPGNSHYDPIFAARVANGANPFKYQFRPKGWAYVKPLEDAAAEDLAERRNLRSMKEILASRGVDEDSHIPEVVRGRGKFIRAAIAEAKAIQKEHKDVIPESEIPRLWREIRYGSETTGVQLAISAGGDADEPAIGRADKS